MPILNNESELRGLQEFVTENKGLPMGPDGKTPDLSKLPRDLQFVVRCSAGLGGDTPVLVANEGTLSNMRRIYTFQSNIELPVFALRNGKVVDNGAIVGIPKEMKVNEIYEVIFSNGYHLECTEGTSFRNPKGDFIPVSTMKVGDPVAGFDFDAVNEEQGIKEVTYTVVAAQKLFRLSESVYLFMSKDNNMLLPHVNEENGTISFVCVQQ
jgi:hypothetical protein